MRLVFQPLTEEETKKEEEEERVGASAPDETGEQGNEAIRLARRGLGRGHRGRLSRTRQTNLRARR